MTRNELITELDRLKEQFKIVNSKEIANRKKPFINVKTFQYILNDGTIINREKIYKGDGDGSAAIILPLTEEYTTILVVQPRPSSKRGIGIELPAGYIDEGENPKEAAIRELAEETGYVPKEIVYLGEFDQDQGCSSAANVAYLALGCEKKLEQSLDRDEYIKYLECNFEDVLYLVDEGIIRDSNSLNTIHAAKKILEMRNK